MLYVLYILFFVACVVLIGSVLLQPGKTDAGALFTSNISNAAFGPRGTASVLSKITIVAATCFMVLAVMISMPALQGGVSVLQTTTADAPAEVPAEQAPAADGKSAPANAAPATNTESPVNAAPEANNAPANQ